MRKSALPPVLAAILATVLWAAAFPRARAADTPVDLELILAVDVSRSMDEDEQKLQRDGYVTALTDFGRGAHDRSWHLCDLLVPSTKVRC
jgi:Protein of unknown function (DUF1194)